MFHFSEQALKSLTGDQCLATVRRFAAATTELLIRYPYDKLRAFADRALECLVSLLYKPIEITPSKTVKINTYVRCLHLCLLKYPRETIVEWHYYKMWSLYIVKKKKKFAPDPLLKQA